MELPRNIKTFLQKLPLKDMRGEDIFVAVVFFLAQGSEDVEIEIRQVQKNWSKVLLGKAYNGAFAYRAQGRVHPSESGRVCLTEEGVSYIQDLLGEVPAFATTLLIFKQGNTHTFDKFLRALLKKAAQSVEIADTYVASSLFDTLLDETPATIPIRFVYGKDTGGFATRAARFAKQYRFQAKESKQFHDRFLIFWRNLEECAMTGGRREKFVSG